MSNAQPLTPQPTGPNTPPSPNSPATDKTPTQKIIPTKLSTIFLMSLIFLVGVGIILWAWRLGPFNTPLQQTDNSYVKAQTTILSSQINGYIDKVYVKDFDSVKQGETLISVSTANYNQQVVQSEAGILQAQTTLANQQQVIAQRQADIKAAQAKVEQAKAQYNLSLQQLQRFQALAHTGAVSQNDVQTSQATATNNQTLVEQAQAGLDSALQALKTAQVTETGLQAQVKSAEAQANQAKVSKNYSAINSPIDGRLGQLNVHLGQYVAVGTQIVSIVPEQTWVIANFKETQMNNIKVGQKAWFTVDALDKKQFTGKVESISPATGSEFSVIKTDNATGNFTKVVQRISVRIAIDPNQPELNRLSPGMSVNTTVDTAS